MAWSPPALERRLWLVEQAGDYAAPLFHHIRDGTATLAAFERRGIDTWVFADGEWLLRDPEGACVLLERRTIGFGPKVVDDFAPYLARLGKLVGASREPALLAECEAALRQELGPSATAHRSQTYYLDVTHPEADKGHALLALAGLLGIAPCEVACIGDMTNDLPMFAVAGLAIAMGNAPPAVQARAAAVTLSNDADGFAVAVDSIVLPRAPGRAA